MQHAAVFARQFARLTWFVRNEPQAIDPQKAALREMVAELAVAPVTLSVQSLRLTADETQIPDDAPGVHDLVMRMLSHGTTRLTIPQGTPPAELLTLSRLLAGEPAPRSTAETVQERLRQAGGGTITVGVVAPTTGEYVAYRPREGSADGAIALPEPPAPRTITALLDRVRHAGSPKQHAEALEELIAAARAAFHRGDVDTMVDVAHAVLEMEKYGGQPDLKPRYGDTLRRLLTPPVLKAIVQAVPREPSRYNYYVDLLSRAGEAGAEAVVAQMGGATSIAERRVFYEILGELDTAVPVLVRMLDDARWYAVRNAVELLGALGEVTVEPHVAEALQHEDERVRRAAALALAKLGTPSAQRDLYHAMQRAGDPVRHAAATTLITGAERAVSMLVEALESDQDDDTQAAIVMALGRVRSPAAVEALSRLARDEGGRRTRRSIGVRVAAIQALGETGARDALPVLRALTHDPEKPVRGAAIWALGKVTKGAGKE